MTSSIEAAVKGWFNMAILAKGMMSRQQFAEALEVLEELVGDGAVKLQQDILIGDEAEDRFAEVEILNGARQLLASARLLLVGEWVPRPTSVKTWAGLGPKLWEKMQRREPPETRLTGESPTRDEVPAIGAPTSARGCWSCRHGSLDDREEPCRSCERETSNRFSKYEPVTPSSK